MIARKARAHSDDAIGILKKVKHHLWRRDDRGTERKRVIFWKSPLAGVRCENRHLHELGKPNQLFGSAGVEHALPSMDDRPLRLEQQLGNGTDVSGIGRRADALWWRVLELAGYLAVAD